MNLEKELAKREALKKTLLPAVYSYKEKRDAIFVNENQETLKKEFRKMKEESLSHMDGLKSQAIAAFKKNGIKVIEANTSKEAAEAIRKLVGKEKLVVKSKSNTADEIDLSDALAEVEVVETDLGDFIVQITDEEDIHPVMPALQMTPEEIANAIKRRFGKSIEPAPEAILAFFREHVRKKIFAAKVGITGANALTADGRILILENEGNVSLVSRIPDRHIVLASPDKIVPTIDDALMVARCAAIYGTGQEYPAYVNIISSPSISADIQNQIVTGAQGAKEIYLVLVNDARDMMLASDDKALLMCINCGACLNFCPVFHQLGHVYGSKYRGAKGVLFAAYQEGLGKAQDAGAFFCTGCLACKENCPADIDLPKLIRGLRARLAAEGLEPEGAKQMIKNIKAHGNPFGKLKEGEIPKSLYCC